MVHTQRWRPVWRISWALNLGLDKNIITYIILSKYRSSHGVQILWQRPRGLWLGDPICCASFKILLMAPCMTPVTGAISNPPTPFTGEPNHELQYFTWIMAFHFLAKSRPEGRLNQWDLSESNPFRLFSWPTTLTSNACSFKVAWIAFTR